MFIGIGTTQFNSRVQEVLYDLKETFISSAYEK